MRRERLVLDTNVIVSAMLVASSAPARVFDHAVANHRLAYTDTSRRELIAALTAPKFDRYVTQATREAFLARLEPVIEIATVFQIVRFCRDPHDDAILEAALNGQAWAIVTGDKDLLALHPFREIAILSPSGYLDRVAQESKKS